MTGLSYTQHTLTLHIGQVAGLITTSVEVLDCMNAGTAGNIQFLGAYLWSQQTKTISMTADHENI